MSATGTAEQTTPFSERANVYPETVFTFSVAIMGALISLIGTGLVFGVDNNVFHLPILDRTYDLPQFAGDQFIQALRYYSSGLWQALAGSASYLDPAWTLFAIGVASRFLAFLGFLACAAHLGVTKPREQIVFVVLLSSCDLMLGYSFAGSNGLFINQSTHSEMTNGLFLLSWSAAARGRFDRALAWTGAAFFCNSFIGMWNFIPLLAMAAFSLRTGRVRIGMAPRQTAIGLAVAGLIAAPMVWLIIQSPGFGTTTPVDYRTFLAGYWPKHFIFDAVPLNERVGIVLVVSLAALSFAALGKRSLIFAVAFGSLVILYLAGVATPVLTSSPLFLNLHLLRVGGPLTLLATLGALSLATVWMTGKDPWRARLIAPGLIATLCVVSAGTVLALILLLIERLPERFRGGLTDILSKPLTGTVVLTGLAVAWMGSFANGAITAESKNAMYNGWIAEWADVSDWSRANTATSALFMIPTYDASKPLEDGDPRRLAARSMATSAAFEYRSQRRVWTDFKRGAAVMWTPSFFTQWRTRTDQVLALKTLDDRMRYARGHDVSHIVDLCAENEGDRAVFRTAHLCVFETITARNAAYLGLRPQL